jgi:hypothetical protein
MLKFFVCLFFSNNILSFDWWQSYTTSVYTNNYLYVYDKYRNDNKSPGITKYTLKDGPIKDLKAEYFNLYDGYSNISPVFINIPDDFKNKVPSGDRAWIFFSYNSTFNRENYNQDYPNISFKIVNDEERDIDSIDRIDSVYSNSFTQSALGITGVREDGSYNIYLYGGIANNGKYKNTVVTNSFFKYDTLANKWIDLCNKTKADLTTAFHKAVNVDDKYIYMLGGIYVFSEYFEQPMVPNNYTMYYYNFQNIRRYNINKKRFEDVNTSTSGPLSTNIKAGRYGFSASYHQGKIYVYGGIESENAPENKGAMLEKEVVTNYLGIFDTESLVWEWYQPKEPNGENSNRKMAFHDSIIWNDQLLLTHGNII